MISLKYIRENKDIIKKTLKAKKVDFDLKKLLNNDIRWRLLVKECDDLKSLRNDVSREIAKLKSNKVDCDDKIKSMQDVSSKIKDFDDQITLLLDVILNETFGRDNMNLRIIELMATCSVLGFFRNFLRAGVL